jgi:hypothetical protein
LFAVGSFWLIFYRHDSWVFFVEENENVLQLASTYIFEWVNTEKMDVFVRQGPF